MESFIVFEGDFNLVVCDFQINSGFYLSLVMKALAEESCQGRRIFAIFLVLSATQRELLLGPACWGHEVMSHESARGERGHLGPGGQIQTAWIRGSRRRENRQIGAKKEKRKGKKKTGQRGGKASVGTIFAEGDSLQ